MNLMRSVRWVFGLVGVLVFVAACGDDAKPAEAQGAGTPSEPAKAAVVDPNENPALRDPTKAKLEAPAQFKVEFETTAGKFTMVCERRWSPHGVDRFYNLVQAGYYKDVAFFRVVKNFVAQFGMHGDPAVNKVWSGTRIPADPVLCSNVRGTVSFAMLQDPNTRSNQLFINLKNNASLDNMRFAPIGKVAEGMDVVDKLYSGYGDGPPQGGGPSQQSISNLGNKYLADEFPKLDYIRSARVLEN